MKSSPAAQLYTYRCDVGGCGYTTRPVAARAAGLAERIHTHRHRRGLVSIPWHPRDDI